MNDEMPLGRGIRCLDTAATTRPTSTGVWSATPTTTLPSRCSSELTSHPPIRVTPRSRSHPSKEDRRTRPNDSAAAVARHWSVSLHGRDGAGWPPRRRSRAGGEHTAIPMHEVDRRTGQPAPDRALSPRSRGLPRHFVGRVPIVVRQQQRVESDLAGEVLLADMRPKVRQPIIGGHDERQGVTARPSASASSTTATRRRTSERGDVLMACAGEAERGAVAGEVKQSQHAPAR